MKAVIIGPVYPYRGGIAHFTTELVRYLKQEAVTVRVFSFKRQYPSFLYPGKTDKDTSQKVMPVEADFLLDPLQPFCWYQTTQQISQESPDVVIIMWWTTFWAPAFFLMAWLLQRKGIKVVFLIHNVLPHEAKPWDIFLSRLALRQGTGFIVLSEKEERRLRSMLPDAKVAMSQHPTYSFFDDGGMTKEKARGKLGLPQDKKIILFFGIVRPYKGLKHLLHAMAKLQPKTPTHLVVAGEFWESESEYDLLIQNLGLQDRVHVFGRYIPNEEVPLYFSAADLFVAPYVDGTQSGAVKVALGFGLPIVVTRSILDETLSRTPNVTVAEDHQPDTLAAAIERSLEIHRPSMPVGVENEWRDLVQVIRNI